VHPCFACTSATACVSCQDGYSLSNLDCVLVCPDGQYAAADAVARSKCVNCPSICTLCSSPSLCFACIAEYFIPDGIPGLCRTCEDGCASCVFVGDQSSCLACKRGYYLKKKVCYSCAQICSVTCTPEFRCSRCISGWFVDHRNGYCAPCDDLVCKDCDEAPDYCISCFSPNQVVQDGKCQDRKSVQTDNNIIFRMQPWILSR
jgi:hypothetical protein